MKKHILFLCTGNSCRSQMAEGWCRVSFGDQLEVYSAGIEKHGLNQNAVRVMLEAGVDISNHSSNTIEELSHQDFDFVVTVCGHADEVCPNFPSKTKVIHQGFLDPPKLAREAKTEEEALDCYRKVRDEIQTWIANLDLTLHLE